MIWNVYTYSNVMYIHIGFQHYCPMLHADASEIAKLEDEFLHFQLLTDVDIPARIWEAAMVYEDSETKHYRMDVLWAYLKELKTPDGAFTFKRLARVALLVLTLPHSNAEEERVFRMVAKNKTKFRPSLKINGTLSSILTIKLAKSKPCHKFSPAASVLKSAKKATTEYNRAHSSKQSIT